MNPNEFDAHKKVLSQGRSENHRKGWAIALDVVWSDLLEAVCVCVRKREDVVRLFSKESNFP